MRVDILKKAGFATTLLISTNSALAGDAYWGLAIGRAALDMDSFEYQIPLETAQQLQSALGGNLETYLQPFTIDVELKDATAYKAFLGLRSGNEGAEIEASQSKHNFEGSGSADSLKVSSVIISGLNYLPLNDKLDLFTKYGINFWNVDAPSVPGLNIDSEGVGLALSAGASMRISRQFSIRMEYQYINDIEAWDTASGDLQQLTVNAAVHY